MRVVSGEKKGLILNTVPDTAVCRPTIDRVKEAMFDIIRFELRGKALDLFSGTGQLGIEALSNGCERVVFCDSNDLSRNLTKSNVKKAGYELRSEIFNYDYKHFLKHVAVEDDFDVIFLDPPFESILAEKALDYISENKCLKPGGIIILESPKKKDFSKDFGDIKFRKKYNYGQISVYIFERAGE